MEQTGKKIKVACKTPSIISKKAIKTSVKKLTPRTKYARQRNKNKTSPDTYNKNSILSKSSTKESKISNASSSLTKRSKTNEYPTPTTKELNKRLEKLRARRKALTGSDLLQGKKFSNNGTIRSVSQAAKLCNTFDYGKERRKLWSKLCDQYHISPPNKNEAILLNKDLHSASTISPISKCKLSDPKPTNLSSGIHDERHQSELEKEFEESKNKIVDREENREDEDDICEIITVKTKNKIILNQVPDLNFNEATPQSPLLNHRSDSAHVVIQENPTWDLLAKGKGPVTSKMHVLHDELTPTRRIFNMNDSIQLKYEYVNNEFNSNQSERSFDLATVTTPKLAQKIEYIEATSSIPHLEYTVISMESQLNDLREKNKEKDRTIISLKERMKNYEQLIEERQSADEVIETKEKKVDSNDASDEKSILENKLKEMSVQLDDVTIKRRDEMKAFSQNSAALYEAREVNLSLRLKIGGLTNELDKKSKQLEWCEQKHRSKIAQLAHHYESEIRHLERRNNMIGSDRKIKSFSEDVASLQTRLENLKNDFAHLKSSARADIQEAKICLQRNCDSLSSYVKEEINSTAQFMSELINAPSIDVFQREMSCIRKQVADINNDYACFREDTKKRICRLEKRLEIPNVHEDIKKGLSSNQLKPTKSSNPGSDSWTLFTMRFLEAINGIPPKDEPIKSYDLDKTKATMLINELSFGRTDDDSKLDTVNTVQGIECSESNSLKDEDIFVDAHAIEIT